jgi:glycosyltransferase involved in cell wall biosynthesis
MNPKVEIDVVLATFNGELFIDEFLESLAGQEEVNIHLIVSDDGSTDSTLEIIKRYESKFHKVTVLIGPRKGPMSNFFFLLRASQGNFVALADQDDVWHQDHLINSINRIRSEALPAMTFSAVEQFDDLNESVNIWPLEYRGPRFPGIIFENTARGCTIVLNGQARDLINIKEPKNAIMHDWWILLLLQLYGSVNYESRPEIRYRLHAQNFIGVPNRRMLAFVKTLRNGRWLPLAQLQELLDYPNTKVNKVETFDIELFAKNLRGGLLRRLRTVILSQNLRYRRSLQDEIKLRFGLVFLRILDRKSMK